MICQRNIFFSRYFHLAFGMLLFSLVYSIEGQKVLKELEDIDYNKIDGKFVAIFSQRFNFTSSATPKGNYLEIHVKDASCENYLDKRKRNRTRDNFSTDSKSPVIKFNIRQVGLYVVFYLYHLPDLDPIYSSVEKPGRSTISEMRPGQHVLWVKFSQKPKRPPQTDKKTTKIQISETKADQKTNNQRKSKNDFRPEKVLKSETALPLSFRVLPEIPQTKVQKRAEKETIWSQVIEVWRNYLRIPIDLIILLGLLRIGLGLRRNHQIIRQVILKEMPAKFSDDLAEQKSIEGNTGFDNLLQANLERADSDQPDAENGKSSMETTAEIPVEEIDSTQIEEISDLEIEQLKEKAEKMRAEEGLNEAEIAQKLGVSGEKVALIFSLGDN